MIDVTRADLALLQDQGRSGFEQFGVPRSGAWDLEQFERLSQLLDEPNPTVIEVLAGSLSFTTSDPIDLALSGFLTSSHGCVDQSVVVGADQSVTIEVERTSYVGIRGLKAKQTLGSAATDTVSGLGPPRLTAGVQFDVGLASERNRVIRQELSRSKTFRFIAGPHGELRGTTATVASMSRSGIRLIGPSTVEQLTLPSIPVLPGAIQDTGTELIVLGPDGAVTGGYPVVGVIATVDLSALARLQPDEEILLVPVRAGDIEPPQKPVVIDLSAL